MGIYPPFIQRMSMPILRRYFALREKYPIWFYLLNRHARRLYRESRPALDGVQERLVRELKETGIAATHLDELFPGEDILPDLLMYSRGLMAGNIKKSNKEFTDYISDPLPVVDMANPLVHFALGQEIIDIVNAYHEMYTRFFYLQLNVSHPMTPGSAPEHSQRWHRDLDDIRMCKVFVYLNDVDNDGGPFMMLPRSQHGGPWRRVFPQTLPFGLYPDEKEVASQVPQQEVRTCTGRAGTVIFCDVSGLHRGGYVTKTSRLMLTIGYRSDASVWPTRVKREESELLAREEMLRGQGFRYAVAAYDESRFSRRLFRQFRKFAAAGEKEKMGMM